MNPLKFLKQIVSTPRARLLWLVLGLSLSAALVQADGPNRVGLVVVHGDGQVIKQCVEFSEDDVTGYDILQKSGLDLSVEANAGMGAAICSINGEGCTFPQEKCFCQCQGSTCIYWSYWYLNGDKWDYSGFGAANRSVSDGDVEGWVWGEGTTSSASPPPVIPFDDICQASPPTSTPTPSPTPTPKPTNTPTPTGTPTPVATPVIHHFTADKQSINAGEQVVLSWDLSDADAAYLQVNGTQEGVIAPGSKTVSPGQTTTYRLVAQNDGGQSVSELTVTVNSAAPAPSPTPAKSAPEPAAAQPANQSAPATATPAPEPVISFRAGASTLPAGACTALYWQVQNATTVFLNEAEVAAEGSQQVCPAQTQQFTLRARYPGGERTAQLQLQVDDSAAAPAAPPTPTLTATAAPAAATATPNNAGALASADNGGQSVPTLEKRRFTVSPQNESSSPNRANRLIFYGGVAAAVLLFLVTPLVLLVAGWVAWWLRGRQ